jgi:hypothetical protein
MFSVVYAVLLRPLEYRDPSRLALVFQTSSADSRQPLLLEDLDILETRSHSFRELAVYYKNTGFSRVTLTGIAEPESVQGGYVTANLIPLLGVAPAIGRTFRTGEEARRERVVLLSHALWVRRFGAARDVVGSKLEIDGIGFQVIGVMPAEFQFPARNIQFWAPGLADGQTRFDLEHQAASGSLAFKASDRSGAPVRPVLKPRRTGTSRISMGSMPRAG